MYIKIEKMTSIMNLCRCCMSDNTDDVDIFCSVDPEFHLVISEVFQKCTLLEINEEDKMPSFICFDCLDNLRKCYRFIQQCKNSDLELRLQIICNDENQDADKSNVTASNYYEQIDLLHDSSRFQICGIKTEKSCKLEFGNDLNTKIDQPMFVIDELSEGNNVNNNNVPSTQEAINIDEDNIVEELPSQSDQEEESLPFDEELTQIKSENDTITNANTDLDDVSSEDLEFKKMLEISQKKKLKSIRCKCEFCGKEFHTKFSLTIHRRIHLGIKPYSCQVCGKSFTSNGNYSAHKKIHIKDYKRQRNHLCSHCGKRFSTSSNLTAHLSVHENSTFQCDICSKSYVSQKSLRNHKLAHLGGTPFECKTCKEKFATYSLLATHKLKHSNKNLECEWCQKSFSRFTALVAHNRLHTGDKPFKCHLCSNRYVQKNRLNEHIKITHSDYRYQCKLCNKQYSHKQTFERHVYSHSPDQPFKCTECAFSFVRKDRLRHHMLKVHKKVLAVVYDPSVIEYQETDEYAIEIIAENNDEECKNIIVVD